MGVRGLTSFIDRNPGLSESFRLHNIPVVIDGYNLVCKVYFSYHVDATYGGDYNRYASAIRDYFSPFLECKIKPILIFDGGYEDRKFKTLIQRFTDSLTCVSNACKDETLGSVLPIMAFRVFCSVISDLGIPFAQCDYEADDQIPALANYYNCPVISNDSDFYIFDIHAGFIRLDYVDMEIKRVVDSNGTECKFLNCTIYHIDKFLSYFPHLDKILLPLLGTLTGNDFVDADDFQNFFLKVRFPKYTGTKPLSYKTFQNKKIMNILCWLQYNTLKAAINEIARYFPEYKRERIKSILKRSVDGYKSNHHGLSIIIDRNLTNQKSKSLLNSTLRTRCGNLLPTDFVVKFHQCQLNAFSVNVITHHRVLLAPQMSNFSFPSTYMCARYIRQVLYGILVRHDTANGQCKRQCCLSSVEEYDHEKSEVIKECVPPIIFLKGFGMLPNINEVFSLQKQKSKEILFKVLGVSSKYISKLPGEWQLLISCINYWLRNCIPHTSKELIYAIILNLIYFLKKGNAFHSKKICSNKAVVTSGRKNQALTATECICSTACLISSISKSSLNLARQNLKQYKSKLPINQDSLNIVHSYSQLQACLVPTSFLNELLGNVLENPAPHLCFNGIMLCNLTKYISSSIHPEILIEELLGGDTNLQMLFKQLFSVICENVPDDCLRRHPSRDEKALKKGDLPCN